MSIKQEPNQNDVNSITNTTCGARQTNQQIDNQANAIKDSYLVIQYAPMVNDSSKGGKEEFSRLPERSEEADFYDIEVLKHYPNGDIECLESHEDISSAEESSLIFDTLRNKYPNAETDILGE